MPHKSIPTRAGSLTRVHNALRRSPQKKIKAKLNNTTAPIRDPCSAVNDNEKIFLHKTIAEFVRREHKSPGFFYKRVLSVLIRVICGLFNRSRTRTATRRLL
jgi:hypothetical protein